MLQVNDGLDVNDAVAETLSDDVISSLSVVEAVKVSDGDTDFDAVDDEEGEDDTSRDADFEVDGLVVVDRERGCCDSDLLVVTEGDTDIDWEKVIEAELD